MSEWEEVQRMLHSVQAQLAGLMTIVDIVKERIDGMRPATARPSIAEDDNCQHQSESRVNIATMTQPGAWYCKDCSGQFDSNGTTKEEDNHGKRTDFDECLAGGGDGDIER